MVRQEEEEASNCTNSSELDTQTRRAACGKCQSQGGPKVTCLSGLLPLCNYDDFICGKNVISNEQRIINVYFPYGLGYVLIGSHS